MIALAENPWDSGVLDKHVHARLVQQSDKFATDAGIAPGFLWAAIDYVCPAMDEQTWLRRFRFHRNAGYAGLVYLGKRFDPTIETRMCGLAGVLVRNFIRARVMSMETLASHLKTGESPQATCLLLPTFAQGRPDERRAAQVADLLIERWNDGACQTVICAPSLDSIGTLYGNFMRDHIAATYQQIHGALK